MRFKTASEVLFVLNSVCTLAAVGVGVFVFQLIGMMLYDSNVAVFRDKLNADDRSSIANTAQQAVLIAVVPLVVTNFVWIATVCLAAIRSEVANDENGKEN